VTLVVVGSRGLLDPAKPRGVERAHARDRLVDGEVRRRLDALAGRASVAEAAGHLQEATPWAYRVLVRQLGVDPAALRPLPQELALRPGEPEEVGAKGLPEDALVIAALETGVPLLAFDVGRLTGRLALRRARAGERLGDDGDELDEGRVVIADELQPVAVVFGQAAAPIAATAASERIALAAVQAKGVPDVAVEEALWTAIEIMRERE
jgi:DNA/RNA-binding domain of Phe-tRNA-synthetase-like protein